MSAVIYPQIFISGVPKNPVVLTPKVFVTGVLKKFAILTPQVFITAIDSREIATADTLRRVDNPNWQGDEIATADTSRRLFDIASADTLRQLELPEIATADTIIRRPHILRYTVETPRRRLLKAAAPAQSLTNSFKDYGVVSFNVTLNERTLSDIFNLEIASQMNINDAAQGQLLDYNFSFLVEETSQQGLIQSVKGMYDIDKLLYSHISSSGTISYRNGDTNEITAAITAGYIVYRQEEGATVFCAKATDIINRAAKYLGLTPNIKIQDFTPYNLSGTSDITYSDLISTLFSWTSRLPQRQINVFIRGGTLHCIQRGLEDSAFDISNLPHSRPQISRKLIRSMYNNPFASYKLKSKDKPDDPEIPDDYSEEEIAVPFSGTISFSDNGSYTSLKYVNGLLRSETSSTSNNKIDAYSRTDYTYLEIFPEGTTDLEIFLHKLIGDFYLHSKRTKSTTITYKKDEITKSEIDSTTEYFYKGTGNADCYLYKESETNYKVEWTREKGRWVRDEDDAETNYRRTYHVPVGNGWYGTSVYLNGEPQGSSLSQGKPGNKVSPYTINQVQKTFTGNVTIIADNSNDGGSGGGNNPAQEYDERRRRLSPIVDTSFPVREIALLYELTDALYWLNRKTQETVSVEITDKIVNGVPTINHIVDFTERVILDGCEYFLVSNQSSFTPRSFIQKLQLVRWF